MNIKALFQRKEPELRLQNCTFSTMIILPDDRYQRFLKNMLDDYDFIRQHRDEMYREGDLVHCILVKGEHSDDGVLVNSEGGDYARYTAYLPAADAFLKQQALEAEEGPQMREISQEELNRMYAQHILWVHGSDPEGEQAVFSGCLLSGLDMRGMELNSAVFREAVFDQMDMQNVGVCFGEFQGAQFVNCNMDGLCGDEANFKDCSFVGCSLRKAKMFHCNLSSATFQDTTLEGADLRWSCLEGVREPEAVFAGANTKAAVFSENEWTLDAACPGEQAMEVAGM